LEHAIESIDGSKFPRNLADARTALAARTAGTSPEPIQVSDAAGEARFVRIVEMILALALAGFVALGISRDDLWIPFGAHYGRLGVIHLHGRAAWIGGLAVLVFAAIPLMVGVADKKGLGMPGLKIVFWVAVMLLALAFGISWYDQTS
jgi:hypothetical protein